MDRVKPPKSLSLEGNVQENWKIWKQNFKFYLIATEYTEKSQEVKAGLFLHCVGDSARQLYNTLTFDTEGDNLKYDKILEKLDAYVTPKKNTTFCRYKFFTYRQEDGQTFDKYLTELRKLCNDCELDTLKDSILKDMLIIGLNNKRVQERLLRDEDITLDNVIKNCKLAELTNKQVKTIQQQAGKENASISYVNKTKPSSSKYSPHHPSSSNSKGKYGDKQGKILNCKFCSFSHSRGSCPAYTKSCNFCKTKGHFAKCCPKKIKKVDEIHQQTQESLSDSNESSDDSYENLFIGAVFINNDLITFDDAWTVDLSTNDTIINYKIDTGAQANILPYTEYIKLVKRPKLKKSNVMLSAYNNSNIPTKGSCILHIQHGNKTVPILFIVADIYSPPIIGLKTSQKLNLVKRIHNINKKSNKIPDYLLEFSDCFGTLGCFSKTHHIYTDPDVKPSVNPPRKVPLALESKLYDELQRMIKLGVIVPVEEPTDWVSSYVAVEKPDKTLRLCLDPRELNKAIKRPTFKLPTTEETLAKISTGKVFTKIDASSAYWQIPVDLESSHLLTFSTPFGRYRFLRMPYGISSASDVCQLYISQVIDGIQGAANSQDDIIIWGENEEQLIKRTITVFRAIRKSGMKLNLSKCVFNISELIFLGHKITADGIQTDDSKVEAIIKMEYPSNVKDLQRFLGSVNYLAKFIPNLSDKTESLRKLLQKEIMWSFEDNHKKEVDLLKHVITEAPVLKIFNSALPTRISCDASSTGLGAILEQNENDNWVPIAYASRSLTSAEKNYCQLEKETLSILFACSRFHQYVYGRKFYVYNDHKPLKAIFNKPLTQAPARIQRFLLRLQQYDFDLHYIKGSLLYIPDTLSRCSLKDCTPEINEDEIKFYVHSIISTDLISDKMFKQLKEETHNDDTLQLLQNEIINGWSENKYKVPAILLPYYKYRTELTIFEGVILRNNRIIVPSTLRKHYMKLLHTSHLGIAKTKTLARTAVYWPGINAQIEELIQSCESCNIYRTKQKQESEIKHDIPDRPWTKIGTDLFVLNSNDFLIVVDYTTNYFDLSLLPDKKSSTVVKHTKQIFSKFGIPKIVVSDNGPEFVGKPYNDFSKHWDFLHITSSPNYPQSNGQVERTIQLVKKTIRKALNDDEDPYLALLAVKASPGPYNSSAPATAMFKRPIRTIIPTVNYDNDIVNNKLCQRGDVGSKYTSKLCKLEINDKVRLHDGKKWSIKGTIVKQLKYPRSYLVLTQNGTKVRRNRRHILLTKKANKSDKLTDNDSNGSFSLIGEQVQDVIVDLDNEMIRNNELDLHNEMIRNNELDLHNDIDTIRNNEMDLHNELSLIDGDIHLPVQPIQPIQVTTRSGRSIHAPSYLRDFDTSTT